MAFQEQNKDCLNDKKEVVVSVNETNEDSACQSCTTGDNSTQFPLSWRWSTLKWRRTTPRRRT
jgi:hypothetical protein